MTDAVVKLNGKTICVCPKSEMDLLGFISCPVRGKNDSRSGLSATRIVLIKPLCGHDWLGAAETTTIRSTTNQIGNNLVIVLEHYLGFFLFNVCRKTVCWRTLRKEKEGFFGWIWDDFFSSFFLFLESLLSFPIKLSFSLPFLSQKVVLMCHTTNGR